MCFLFQQINQNGDTTTDGSIEDIDMLVYQAADYIFDKNSIQWVKRVFSAMKDLDISDFMEHIYKRIMTYKRKCYLVIIDTRKAYYTSKTRRDTNKGIQNKKLNMWGFFSDSDEEEKGEKVQNKNTNENLLNNQKFDELLI